MSNANALYDLTKLAFCPNLWWNSFDQHWLLAFCHLSFDEHLSWKHRDDILTNSCHIISSLVGTVSNIVCWSGDQRIYSGQVCKFGRRATVSILPKLYQLSSGFNNLEGKPLSFSVHQAIKEYILVISPNFRFWTTVTTFSGSDNLEGKPLLLFVGQNMFWSCHQLSILDHSHNLPTTSVTVHWSDRRRLRQSGTSPSCEKRNSANPDVYNICLDFS